MSVHQLRTESGHLEQVLDYAIESQRTGQSDLLILNMVHAVQVALGVDDRPEAVPVEVRRRLDTLTRIGGEAA